MFVLSTKIILSFNLEIKVSDSFLDKYVIKNITQVCVKYKMTLSRMMKLSIANQVTGYFN
jgi:hypothetical protein